WIACGQSSNASAVTPVRSTSPHAPSSITFATNALQLRSGELGNPEKLQVQPGAQLQNSYPLPRRRHLVFCSVMDMRNSLRSGEIAHGCGVQQQHGAEDQERDAGDDRQALADR